MKYLTEVENTDPYQLAESVVKKFLSEKILDYSKLRNFDFGRNNHTAVSQLSPFISHGIISEFDLIEQVVSQYSYSKVEKFIQEIFWRVYWKGWLEHRPSVYQDLVNFSTNTGNEYDLAIDGKTDIECFNDWVYELRTDNYLHNHARMWFASIWIFTLKLPWQLGAQFFQKYLFDGDPASNTLSWRWVAGLQTKGKSYLARSSNIGKFTNGKYRDLQLVESAPSLAENYIHELQDLSYPKETMQKNDRLLIFDTQLYLNSETVAYDNYEEILVVVLDNEERGVKLDLQTLIFKKKLAEWFCNHVSNAILVDNITLKSKLSDLPQIDSIYPTVGDNLFFLNRIVASEKLDVNLLVREMDRFCWNFSKKGFFNFKKNIPLIIDKIKRVG